MMRFAAVFLVLSALPVTAQELAYSDAGTANCLDQARSSADRQSCIGTSALACIAETPAPSRKAIMRDCFEQERAFWDARLNEMYQALRSQDPAGTRLRDMQRAWILYRDARCDYAQTKWGSDQGRIPCLMHTTGEQTLLLETYIR